MVGAHPTETLIGLRSFTIRLLPPEVLAGSQRAAVRILPVVAGVRRRQEGELTGQILKQLQRPPEALVGMVEWVGNPEKPRSACRGKAWSLRVLTSNAPSARFLQELVQLFVD